jgi:hypothetical protein
MWNRRPPLSSSWALVLLLWSGWYAADEGRHHCTAWAWQIPTATPKHSWMQKSHSNHPRRRSYGSVVVPFSKTATTTQLSLDRRDFFHQVTTSTTLIGLGTTLLFPTVANAGGLLQFPVTPACPLKNIYHFLRAGPSELEMEGIYSTNPLFLTNRDNAMHSSGTDVILQALQLLRQQPPTVAYHSLAANGMDTGDLVARELKLGREKLLPEFTYLDPRGIGIWNDSDERTVKPAIWALDYLEAGDRGMGGRPPPHVDGTPNETLNDQFVRLRQFLSLQESRTAGDVILVIFPDGTGPALLSCMIAGIPYKDCHVLEYQPGEVRLNITPESVWQLYEERKKDPVYWETIERGKEELKLLREQGSDSSTVISLKERREDKVQADIEQAYQERKKAEVALEAQKRQEQAQRQQQIEMEYQERNRQKKQEREKQLEQKPANNKNNEVVAAPPAWKQQQTALAVPTNTMQSNPNLPTVAGLGALGLGALGLLVTASSGSGGTGSSSSSGNARDEGQPQHAYDASTPHGPAALVGGAKSSVSNRDRGTIVDDTPLIDATTITTVNGEMPTFGDSRAYSNEDRLGTTIAFGSSLTPGSTSRTSSNDGTLEDAEVAMTNFATGTTPSKTAEDALHELAMAEQAMKDALVEAAQQQQQGSLFDRPVPTITGASAASSSTGDLFDDGADDWLRVLVQIRDEDDEALPVVVLNGSNDLFDEY